MKNYDYIIVGNGSGGIVAGNAVSHGKKVALINKEPPGGTCMNFGCIPTKTIIHPADVIVEIENAGKFGISAEIKNINFNFIMDRMRKNREKARKRIRKGLQQSSDIDLYKGEAHFTDEYTLEINGERINGKNIVLSCGARPLIPPIEGVEDVDYLTNETLLELKEKPESMIIIGGGYVSVEFAHFLSAVGTDVTVLERNKRIVKNEEHEISELLKEELSRRMEIENEIEVTKVKKHDKVFKVTGRDLKNSRKKEFTAEKVLIATGRKSNADLLETENTGVETDKRGFVKVNDFLETTKENIWAMGDITGNYMFKHVANQEATLLSHNLFHEQRQPMDYTAVPHAIFTHPRIAGVGLTEEEALKEHEILIGKAKYSRVAMGKAMKENKGFAKAIVDKNDFKILGFHIIGPHASILIQEVVNLKALHLDIRYIDAIHIHPALPELIIETFNNLQEI